MKSKAYNKLFGEEIEIEKLSNFDGIILTSMVNNMTCPYCQKNNIEYIDSS